LIVVVNLPCALMVNSIRSGFSALEAIEKGCSVSEKGVFQAVSQANWPG